jgi:hypothetical protein
MTTHEEEDESDDETVSINDKSYEERHRGICESCHHIGILGTTCENCEPNEWASIVKITPGWQSYLNKRHHEESLGPEALMMTMQTHGIRICCNCNIIGTKGFYCRNCDKQPGMMNRAMYIDNEEVLQNGERGCFNCHSIWKANTICRHCCESMVAQLPKKRLLGK